MQFPAKFNYFFLTEQLQLSRFHCSCCYKHLYSNCPGRQEPVPVARHLPPEGDPRLAAAAGREAQHPAALPRRPRPRSCRQQQQQRGERHRGWKRRQSQEESAFSVIGRISQRLAYNCKTPLYFLTMCFLSYYTNNLFLCIEKKIFLGNAIP